MGPINRGRQVPMRNEAGRFIKHFVPSSPGQAAIMKTITVKGKKFKRRALDAPRIGKKTSVVWHFFKALPHENGISRAVCLLCKVIFKNPGGSTTGMRGHLDRKHPGVIDRVLDADKIKLETKHRASLPVTKTEHQKAESRSQTPPPPHLSIENGAIGEVGETEIFEQENISLVVDIDGEQQSSSFKRKQHILPGPPPEVYSVTETDEVTKSIVMYLASSMQPMRKVEDVYFKKMLYNMNSGYLAEAGSMDSDSVLSSVIDTLNDLYTEIKEDIQRRLQEKYFSVSIELWCKTNSEIYVLVTANYITKEWVSEHCFLGLRHLQDICLITHPDAVTEKVSHVVSLLMQEYELKPENIVHVLFNSSPFSLNSDIASLTTWPCLNDTVRRSYDLINEFSVSVTNCDLLNNTLKIGKQVLPNYKEVKKHPGKLMEEMKNFLSTHDSMESLPVKVEDLDECIKLQEPFNVIVDSLLEQTIVTASSILPLIYFVRDAYQNQINDGTSSWPKEQRQEIINTINNQIETSYKVSLSSNDLGDPMLAVCTFLDPRYKKLKFLTEEQRNNVYDTVTELLHDLIKGKTPNSDTGSIISVRSENPAYNNMKRNVVSNATDPLNPTTSSSSSSSSTPQQSSGQSAKLASVLSTIVERRIVKLASAECMEELTNYWDEPVAVLTMDPYQWWSFNHHRFPKVAELAKRYLCIRGNSTYARLNFTGAGKRFNDKLANIEPEYVDKLQVVRRYHSLPVELTDNFVPQDTSDEHMDPIKTETVEGVELMDEEV